MVRLALTMAPTQCAALQLIQVASTLGEVGLGIAIAVRTWAVRAKKGDRF